MSTSPVTLPMSDIVDVVVQIAPVAPAQPTFNQGLIIGPSTHIPIVGTNPRIRQYSTLAQMVSDGFLTTDPEYIAAQIYFSQSPAPQYLWIGRRCEVVGAVMAVTLNAGGTGYHVNDILSIVQGAETGAQVTVDTVDVNGVITSFHLSAQGVGYTVANALAVTGGAGLNATFNITQVGPESALQAAEACRIASFLWYSFLVTDAVKADHEAIAAWAESATPTCQYYFTTSDADVPGNVAGNIFAVLKALSYSRTFGIYSTIQNGLYPNNIYAAAAVMGVAMGLNSGLANSYFTLKFKTLVGISVEPLSQTSITNIEGNNGNDYLSYGNAYTLLEQGVEANGQFLDEILNLDMLVSDIQYGVMNLFTQNPAVPQTDPGETQLIHAINVACDKAVTRGFLAPGTWQGAKLLNLNPGDAVPKGYVCQAQPFSQQSTADRQARKAMPVYVAITEAGAMHSVLIGVYVQR